MSTNSIFNRVEVLFYSSLVSALSEMNQIRAQLENLSNYPKQVPVSSDTNPLRLLEELPQQPARAGWIDIRQSLSAMLIWIILGFAVGLLFGMINPR